jgi:hypothetical protein
MQMNIPNLLLIAGNGNKSGKTTLACRIIEQFRDSSVIGVKITPHFHETTPGLKPVSEKPGYSVYEETDENTDKDTSRMLKAGAARVYFAKVTDNKLPEAFMEIYSQIPAGSPVVCESPALRYYTDPGLFIIIKSDIESNTKDISNLIKLPHVMLKLSEVKEMQSLPISFTEGGWIMKDL